MLVCPTCAAPNPDGSRFCGVCGAVLAPAAPTQVLAAPPRPRPAWLLPALVAGVVALLAVGGAGAWLALRSPTAGGAVAAATTSATAKPTRAASRSTPRPTAGGPKETPANTGQVGGPAQSPTDEPAQAPTDAPTEEPSQAPTDAPTQAPAFGPLGSQSPARMSASGTAPDSVDSQGNTTTYNPANAADGALDTAWRVPGDGAGDWLLLEFPAPVLVREVRILPGYAKVDPFNGVNRFTQNRRVRRVRLEFDDGSTREATLADQPQLQPIPVDDVLTSSVRVVVLETTAPSSSDGRDFTPIGEVVVVGRARE